MHPHTNPVGETTHRKPERPTAVPINSQSCRSEPISCPSAKCFQVCYTISSSQS